MLKEWVKSILAWPRVGEPLRAVLHPFAKWLPDAVVYRVPVAGLVAVPLPGSAGSFMLDVGPYDSIAMTVYWRGLLAYEPGTVRVLSALAEQARSFIDVGANIGVYSLLVAALNPNARVVAVEPVPTIYARLRRNASINQLANLDLRSVAISDHGGEAVIYVPKNQDVPIEASLLQGYRPDTYPVSVQVETIDELVSALEIGRLDLLKVDTEGTTALVLDGALETLRRDAPCIICEVLSEVAAEARVGAILADLGYDGYSLTADGPKSASAIRGDPTHENLNYLFVHRSRAVELSSVLDVLSASGTPARREDAFGA